MRLNPDQALENYRKVSKKNLDNPSESDTRSKIIDPILQECLNWQSDDIFREEYANPGFVDYILKIGTKNVLIIEAKKMDYSFKLPITFGFLRDYTLGQILKKEKTVSGVIEQARRYCQDKGAKFGAITNGDQFIIFEAQKYGQDWTSGNCKVFYNNNDIENNFVDFWNLFSKDAIESGSLLNELSSGSEELHFIKPVDDVRFKNEIEPRNELYRYMIPIINRTFKEITEENQLEMLKDCYVLDPESGDEASNSLKSYIRQDLGQFECKEIIQGEETAGIFHTDFYNKWELVQKGAVDPIICLLLGGVGSGKTTFVFRFFNIVLDDEERNKVKWFYVDFRDAPTDEKSIRDYIFKCVLEDFRRKYGALYITCLDKLKKETIEPTLVEISQLFRVLRDEGYVLSLVVDNVDQHVFESPTFHESVFMEANNLAKELRAITIMTLREESFYKSSTGGPFDAYYIEQYRIKSPDMRKLLLLRLEYIMKKLKLKKCDFQRWLSVSSAYDPPIEMISDFLSTIIFTLQQRANKSVSRFVSGTSGGNTRRGLELFANFLVSGNTKIREILEKKKISGNYIIAEHQFVKSIVLGNWRYYSKNSSYLMNIFDVNQSLSTSHFLRLKILQHAEDQASIDSEYGSGYVSINRLSQEAGDISISRSAIEDALILLAKFGLIELNTRSKVDLKEASHFKITDCGAFFLRLLSMRFSYLDLILADTPIADADVALKIRHLLPSRELADRFERTHLFVSYLKKMEDKEFVNSPEYELNAFGKHKFGQKIVSSFDKEKKYIIESQKRKEYLREQDTDF
jgi:hypothetical protein